MVVSFSFLRTGGSPPLLSLAPTSLTLSDASACMELSECSVCREPLVRHAPSSIRRLGTGCLILTFWTHFDVILRLPGVQKETQDIYALLLTRGESKRE